MPKRCVCVAENRLQRAGWLAPLLAGLALVVTLQGCASSDELERRPHGRARPLQPKLVDSAQFFDGTLLAEVSLEPILFHSPGGAEGDDQGGGGGHRRRGHGGGGGFSGGSGERSRGGDLSEGPPSGDGAAGMPMMRRPLGSSPTIELKAKFTNNSDQPMTFAVTDVVSVLGNFAVRPERLTLAPHESGELDAMPAVYPDTINELNVELRVRRTGHAENHSVRLHAAAPPEAPADK